MNLQHRLDLLVRLGHYMSEQSEEWLQAKETAFHKNNWFLPAFIDQAVSVIVSNYLQPKNLNEVAESYHLPFTNPAPKKVGIVMAGNIPLVGFHDLLCTFLTGHYAVIKLSSKDDVLTEHLIQTMIKWNEETAPYFSISTLLKGCDAYIATGSNNTARYFEFYFQKYPHIIRKNRTSVALLRGDESPEELEKLAEDVHLYFGLGCRNVTKLYVPQGYDFIPLLDSFNKYSYLIDHHKYKNNYDYNLALHLLNKKYYMTNGTTLLIEEASLFSPISQVNYEYYEEEQNASEKLKNNDAVQCIIGRNNVPFGIAQYPCMTDFADGVDTLQFLLNLNSGEEDKEVRKS
ncbi:MAG: acyl-CoA reductase [Chitinophagaceae bacterium]